MRRWYAVLASTAIAMGVVVFPVPATASTDDPVPIPGGIDTGLAPPYGPVLHVFAPGPTELGFMGSGGVAPTSPVTTDTPRQIRSVIWTLSSRISDRTEQSSSRTTP
jgi:hypothetical protein